MSVRSRTFRHVMRCGLICLVAASGPQMARADGVDTKKSCVSSFERAQRLRASTRLRDSREALIECSKEACPNLIRRDCTQWMGEVLASLPSVVFGAQDAEGKDVAAVRVSVDGVVVQERLEGKAIPLDPGLHVVRYELADGTMLEDKVLVREGEKNRALMARFSRSSSGQAATLPTTPLSPSLEPGPDGSPRSSPTNLIVAIASGALGLGALGASLAFDVTGTSEAHALPCATARDCTDSQIEPARQKYEYADILLGVGAAAVALGVVVLAVRPFHAGEAAKTGSSLQIDASFARGGGAAWLRLAF
jgi:hypothetical protein